MGYEYVCFTFYSFCLELEGKDVEDLFTAVLSPSTNQPPQLTHPPNTAPNASASAMSLQNPGIKLFISSDEQSSKPHSCNVVLCLSITCKLHSSLCECMFLHRLICRKCWWNVPTHAYDEWHDGAKHTHYSEPHDCRSWSVWHILFHPPHAFSRKCDVSEFRF